MLDKLIVTISGVLLIVLVNWYFLFSKRKRLKPWRKRIGENDTENSQ